MNLFLIFQNICKFIKTAVIAVIFQNSRWTRSRKRRYKGCLPFKFSFKLGNPTPWQLNTKYQCLLSFTFYGTIYSVIFHCVLFNTETRSRDRLLTVSVCYRVRCNAVVVVTCFYVSSQLKCSHL